MGCADHVFVLSSLMSLYLAQKKKLFVTFIDYEKAFDKVDHGLLWQKLGQAHVTGKNLRIIQNLSQKTKACVRVNGEIFDIFDCNIGVRQGDKLFPLLFKILLNDFNTFMQSGFDGIRLTPDQNRNLRTLLKLYSLLYADDTIFLSETVEDMQRALDATTKNCKENKMTINASKTKYMVCSRGKIRKKINLFVNNTAIERVDTFCYLGVVFRYNNTFQAAIKNNVDKAKKALFKLEVLFSKIDFGIDTKLHLFDAVMKPILLYGCEVWGYESMEQIEIFHRYFLRRCYEKMLRKLWYMGSWGKKN